MGFRRDNWRAPSSKCIYKATDKEYPGTEYDMGGKQYAHWMFARKIEEILPNGGTILEIYEQITRPMGINSHDTTQMVFAAKREGYIE